MGIHRSRTPPAGTRTTGKRHISDRGAYCHVFLAGRVHHASAQTYPILIPEGYAGWLCVTFGTPAAPPLPAEDGFYLVRFPADGRVLTSTVVEGGKMRDEFYYYVAERRIPLDAGQSLGGGYTLIGGASRAGVTCKFGVIRHLTCRAVR